MLARQRHDIILDAVRRQGSVRVRELADLLGVSDMTVRRDLDQLSTRNLIDKVHGGATRVGNQSTHEPGFDAKLSRQQVEKERIAERAASLVRPGSSIGLTAGTTTWTMAKRLTTVPNLTIVTNAPNIAQTLHRSARPDQTVVLTGGIRTPSDALVGSLTTGSLAKLHLDMVFMGVHGMDLESGFTTPNLAEAEVNAAFITVAQKLTVVADHTKWGTRGLAQIAPLDNADVLVSDHQLPSSAVRAFTDLGTDLHLV